MHLLIGYIELCLKFREKYLVHVGYLKNDPLGPNIFTAKWALVSLYLMLFMAIDKHDQSAGVCK